MYEKRSSLLAIIIISGETISCKDNKTREDFHLLSTFVLLFLCEIIYSNKIVVHTHFYKIYFFAMKKILVVGELIQCFKMIIHPRNIDNMCLNHIFPGRCLSYFSISSIISGMDDLVRS